MGQIKKLRTKRFLREITIKLLRSIFKIMMIIFYGVLLLILEGMFKPV